MATASRTLTRYVTGEFSWRKLQALIDQHNTGVKNDRAIMALLDAETTTTAIDNNYAAQVTSKEIKYEGYTPGGAYVAGLGGAFPLNQVSEELVKALVDQQNVRVANARTIIAKLNGDDGITATNYAVLALKVVGVLGVTGVSGESSLPAGGYGTGPDGAILQAISTQQAALCQDWHNIAVKLDADSTTVSSYEAVLTALVVNEHGPNSAES